MPDTHLPAPIPARRDPARTEEVHGRDMPIWKARFCRSCTRVPLSLALFAGCPADRKGLNIRAGRGAMVVSTFLS